VRGGIYPKCTFGSKPFGSGLRGEAFSKTANGERPRVPYDRQRGVLIGLHQVPGKKLKEETGEAGETGRLFTHV